MTEFTPRGTFTALVTPFSKDATRVDWEAFEAHVGRQLDAGVTGLVPCGTTGESPTLNLGDQSEAVRRTVRLAKGKATVLAGVGSNDTSKVVELTRAVAEAGADAAMVVMPYYNKPDQRGLLAHMKAVAQASSLPLVLYNVPSRTSVSLKVDTTLEMIDSCPTIVAIKDASNNVHYCQNLLRRAGDRIRVFSGDDALTVPLMSVGAIGVISVTSNVLPKAVKEVVDRALAGNFAEASELHLRLLPVHEAMFSAPSPVPAKCALAARGFMEKSVRLPLVEATPEVEQRILAALRDFEGGAV